MGRVVASMLKALGFPPPTPHKRNVVARNCHPQYSPRQRKNKKRVLQLRKLVLAELHLTRKRWIWGWRSSVRILGRRKAIPDLKTENYPLLLHRSEGVS